MSQERLNILTQTPRQDNQNRNRPSAGEASVLRLIEGVKQVEYSYNSFRYISVGTSLARAYEENEIEKRRLRTFDQTPYIDHPIAMASEAVRMRLDPTLVIASLLHDLPEDVVIGDLKRPSDWMKFIDNTYSDYPDKERLMRILRAELKTEDLSHKFPDKQERQSVVNFYMNSPIGKVAEKYLSDLKGDREPIKEEEQEQIAEVLFDLNRLVSDSFVVDASGQSQFDPSILTLKILDTWDNLKTIGFWRNQLTDSKKSAKTVAKLIRARVLTNFAEFLGMREISSDMTISISAIQRTDNIDSPFLNETLGGSENSGRIFDGRIQMQKVAMSQASDAAQKVSSVARYAKKKRAGVPVQPFMQMPWGDSKHGAVSASYSPFMLHAPSYLRDNIEFGEYEVDGYVIGRKELSHRDGVYRPDIKSLYGRRTRDFPVTSPEGIVYRLRLEDATPGYIATLKAKEHRPTLVSGVPERNMFHRQVCEYMDSGQNGSTAPTILREYLDPNHMGLLSFMLSPRMLIEAETGPENTPYIIFVGPKMYLASNKTDSSLWDIAKDGGITNPVVHSLGSDKIMSVTEGDHHVLDRMKVAGELNQYHIVIVENDKKIK